MSTRCRIGLEETDGFVRHIYCHCDGYLDGVGATLIEHYKSEAKVRALIKLGDLSSLHEEVVPPPGQMHTYEKRVDGITVAYGRDRGESDIEAKSDKDWKAYLRNGCGSDIEYVYLYRHNAWFYTEGKTGPFRLVTPQLVAEKLEG